MAEGSSNRWQESALALLLVVLGSGCGDDDEGPSEGFACAEVDSATAAFEEEVRRLTNEARASGHDCDSAGSFGKAPPLAMDTALRCAARNHAAYMARTGNFDHVQPDSGSDPFERIESAGYRFRVAGENIAVGQRTPQEVVSGWLDSDGHCANIMNPEYRELGVGYAVGTGKPVGDDQAAYWTQSFAAPL